MDTHTYKVDVTWLGNGMGNGEAEKVGVPVFFSAPPEFGGTPGFWSPEQLLVLAANSCFMSTLMALAHHSQLTLVGYRAQAEGRLEKVAGQGYRMTEIVIQPVATVLSDEGIALAQRLLEKAERVCIVANALKVPIRVDARVEVVEPAPVG